MSKKLKISILLIVLICIGSTVFYFYGPKLNSSKNTSSILPVNHILILSFCSVSTNQLPFFGHEDFKDFPNLKRILDESYGYKNAYASLSWSNIKRNIFRRSFNEKFKEDVEFAISAEQTWSRENHEVTFLRVPEKEDLRNEYGDYFTDRRLIEPFENFDNVTKKIIEHISDPSKNNIVLLHFKMMHYPYLGQKYLENKKLMEETFTSKELELIKEYSDNPDKYPEKLPFFQVTLGVEKVKNILINKNNQFLDVSTSIELNNKWKQSKDFQTDLSILKKAYHLRLKDLDRLLGKYYDFYKKELEEKYKMALIVTGDHGEALLEHDYLTHASTPYDEVLHYFQTLHFPKQNFSREIHEQMSQGLTAELIERLIRKKVTGANFEGWQGKNKEDPENKIIIGYSCNMDIISARQSSKWKLIYWVNSGESKLFDLESDPKELVDVSDKHPDIVADLKVEVNLGLTERKLAINECIH